MLFRFMVNHQLKRQFIIMTGNDLPVLTFSPLHSSDSLAQAVMIVFQ